MKREDITRILEGAALTDAQIKELLDLNSADIGRALGKQKDALDAANEALSKANNTIAELEKNKGDTEALQKQIDDYKAADDARKAAEKAAQERAELMERLDAVMGDRKFAHDRLRDVVADDFGKALQDKANRGKSDKDIFDALTDGQNYFANQNAPTVNMPPMGNPHPADVKDMAGFLKLSYDEQVQYKQAHPTEFKQMLASQMNMN